MSTIIMGMDPVKFPQVILARPWAHNINIPPSTPRQGLLLFSNSHAGDLRGVFCVQHKSKVSYAEWFHSKRAKTDKS